MKKVIATDFFIITDKLAATILLCMIVGAGLALLMETPIISGAPLAMGLPYTFLVWIWMSDDQNSWGTYRLTLPQSRRATISGRYMEIILYMLASTMLGSLFGAVYILVANRLVLPSGALTFPDSYPSTFALTIAISAAAALVDGLAAVVSIPVFATRPATRAVTSIPLISMFLIGLVISGISSLAKKVKFGDYLTANLPHALTTPSGLLTLLLVGFTALTLVLLALSWAVALKLYEAREF